jgi:PAS domain S-box-containing protein
MRIGRRHYIAVDFTIAPIRNDEGKIIYLIPSGVDVSQKVNALNTNKALYKQLDEEKKRLEQIIGNTPGVVWETIGKPYGGGQKMAYLSDYIDIMVGYKKEDRQKEKDFWIKIVHPEDRERVIRETEIIYMSGEGGSSRYRWVTKKGKIIWVETRMVLIKDNRGKIIGARGVTVDITDRISLEQRKDEFTSIASHELKTPLTTIKAFTQILGRRLELTGDNESLSYINKMNTYIGRLTKIIYDFLDFSKIQAGKLDLFQEEFELNGLVSEVVEDMQSTVESHNIQLVNEIPRVKVYGDRNRISQVLINLISNAVKYSPEADKVEVKMETNDNKIVVAVKDYGVGIPKDNQGKIFDRFYRVNQPKKIKIEGFGLGLYISGEIIGRHKGKIWFDSVEGEGSTFYFSLPILNLNDEKKDFNY